MSDLQLNRSLIAWFGNSSIAWQDAGSEKANNYLVQRSLGKRPGRQTLLATDARTGEFVVLKLLALGSSFDWQDLKLFEREAATLQTLSHPAIPRYLDYFSLDLPNFQGFVLVQSYIEGRSLEEQAKAGRRFSEAEVKTLARELLLILNDLHQQNPPIIHRDIKPSNILLGDRSGNHPGQVFLVDFGSVQNLATQAGSTVTVVGTYGYMPPEQFGGRSTPASDLYSLGATLIFLATGRHPTELPQQNFQIQFRQQIAIDPVFASWLEWMTEPSCDRRLQSAQDALQASENPRFRYQLASRSAAGNLPVKPHESQIQLTKNDRKFQVVIPPKGVGWGLLSLLSLITPLWGFSLPLLYDGYAKSSERLNRPLLNAEVTPLAIRQSAHNQIALFWTVSIVAIALALWFLFELWTTCTRRRLLIDQDSLWFTTDLFGLPLWWRRLARSSIRSVEYSPKLKIEAAQRVILGSRHVSEAEAFWLQKELLHWLRL